MIDKEQLISKLGKKGFRDFVVNNRSNQPTGFDKTRGIKGRIKWQRCEHGVWTIENYEKRECERCSGVSRVSKSPDFRPYFNIGLGAFVESRGEERRLARAKGYVEAG